MIGIDYGAAAEALWHEFYPDASWELVKDKSDYYRWVKAAVDAALGEVTAQAFWCRTHKYQSQHSGGRCGYSVKKLMQTHPEEIGGCSIVSAVLFEVSE